MSAFVMALWGNNFELSIVVLNSLFIWFYFQTLNFDFINLLVIALSRLLLMDQGSMVGHHPLDTENVLGVISYFLWGGDDRLIHGFSSA